MNNLKRVLSMALASVMVIGSVVVGSSAADFADKADIKNTEAVNAMVSLNILKGKEDGTNFAPNDLVTREEMAKMIFVALNGGKDNNALTTKAIPTYTDIKGTWAEGYIEYCSALGIIAGKGDGTFDPKGTVTGQQAAKMLLICIGYDAEAAGLQGTVDWGINTDSLAFTKGFYNGVDIATGDFLSRDNAAQIVYNALQAKMVEYDYKLTADAANLTTKAIVKDKTDSAGDKVDLLEERYDLRTYKGILTEVTESEESGKTVYSIDSESMTIGGETYGGWTNTKNDQKMGSVKLTKIKTDYSNLLGQEVKVMFKKNHTDDVFGVYATNNNTLVVSTAQNKVDTVSNSKTKVKFGGVEYDTTSKLGMVEVFVDGVYSSIASLATLQDFKQADGEKNFNNLTIIDNDGDGKVDAVLATTVTAAKVTYKSSTEIIAGGETYKYEDDEIPADVARDDYVVVWSKPTDLDKHVITKLEALNGAITGVKAGTSSKPQEIQVNGTWYKNYNKLNSGEEFTNNSNVTAYVYNGIVAYAEASSAANMNDVAVVVAYNTNGVTPQAKLYFTDKTTKTVDVNTEKSEWFATGNTSTAKRTKFDDAKPGVNDLRGKFFEATSTSSGYKLLECQDDKKVGNNTYHANDAASTDLNDNAVVLAFNDSNSTKTYTGKQLKNNPGKLGTAIAGFTAKTNGLERLVFASISITGAWPEGLASNGDKYAYVTAKYWEIDGGTQYTVWTGTESITVTDKDEKVQPDKNDVISYTSIDNGEIKGAKVETLTSGWVQGKNLDKNYVYLNGNKEGGSNKGGDQYKIESDTVILYVDTANAKGISSGEIDIAEDVKVKDTVNGASYKFYTKNVRWLANDGNDYDELEVLVVDSKGKLGKEYNINVNGDTNSYVVDKNKVKSGDIIKVSLWLEDKTAADVTLTNAKFLENVSAGDEEFSIVATGDGTVGIKF